MTDQTVFFIDRSPSAASKKKSGAQLLAAIENGRPPTAMEGWKGQLSDVQIRDVLAYVKTLRE